jgi:lipopolysaccharide export LptBFGC system permease protein LptF
MIWYEFHIPFNGIYPIVKQCPVGHCSKYKAWKYLKEQYPNSFVSYAGKYSDSKGLLRELEIAKFNKDRFEKILLDKEREIARSNQHLSRLIRNRYKIIKRLNIIKHEIRQREFRLT